MPIIRKILNVGDSRAITIPKTWLDYITIPKTWLDYIEKEHGIKIKEVAIEVDRVLTIQPILPKKEVNPSE